MFTIHSASESDPHIPLCRFSVMDQASWISIMQQDSIVHTCLKNLEDLNFKKYFLRGERSCLRMDSLRQRFMCEGFLKGMIPRETGQRARETG